MRTLLLLTCALISANAMGDEPAPLTVEAKIALPGVKGRIDHLAVDVAEQRLFIAALGNGTVEVVDLKSRERVQSVQ